MYFLVLRSLLQRNCAACSWLSCRVTPTSGLSGLHGKRRRPHSVQWPLSKAARLSDPVRGMAARTVLEPVTAHLPLRFHPLSACENAMAVSYARVVIQLRPLAGIDSARSPLFSDDAPPYVSFRRAQLATYGSAGRNLLARRRACSTPCLGGPRQPLDRQL